LADQYIVARLDTKNGRVVEHAKFSDNAATELLNAVKGASQTSRKENRLTMKPILFVALAVLATHATATHATAEELVSGPQAGEKVTGFFDFDGTKCAGPMDRYPIGTKGLRYY
jgi:hypothetical protein